VITKGRYIYGTVYGSFFGNWSALKNFDERMRFLNITAEELKQKCGEEVRKTYTVEVTYFNDYNQLQQNNTISGIINSTTFIGESTICFSLRLDLQSFSSQYEYWKIAVRRPESFYSSEKEENGSLAIDLSGRDNTLNQTDFFGGSKITASFGQQYSLGITITAFYSAIPYSRGTHKCSADTTLDDCQDDCRITTIRKLCNCTPASWSKLATTATNFCSLDDYENCLQTADNFTPKCSAGCLRSCTRIKYQQVQVFNFNSSVQAIDRAVQTINGNTSVININFLNFQYFIYGEAFAYSTSEFFRAFGGILVIWVGLNFLFFAELLYWTSVIVLRALIVLIRKNGSTFPQTTIKQIMPQQDILELQDV
jgi:hypothetical protein